MGIENRLHWVRDVTFAENASLIHSNSAPQIFNALCNASISCQRSMETSHIAAALGNRRVPTVIEN